MCSCININCQYRKFLKNRELYYIKNEDFLPDEYCIFHATKELKEEFTYYQNEIFKTIINEYIAYCVKETKKVDFSNSIFNIIFDVNNLDLKENDIDFTKTVFLKYFRMDNLKCNELIFKDTEFHNGGGIKNRVIDDNVNITSLEFRPFTLEKDFVIDIGNYANDKGLIEQSSGTIENIRFENHKDGDGIIYFIGFNEKLKEANFRNMILDNVSFQNCDLRNCYFLNAKVNETEFRNCEFLENSDYYSFNKYLNFILFSGIIVLIIFILMSLYIGNISENYYWLCGMVIPFILMSPINKHYSVQDEIKGFSEKEGYNNINTSLVETYKMLRENFARNDYQRSGDFFYSQRLTQLKSSRLPDKITYIFHYIINGFGENFIKPLFTFILLIFLFSGFYVQNKDFIATDQTPTFLVIETNDINKSLPTYKNQIYLDENNTLKQKRFISNKLNNEFKVRLIYSASQFISPFVAKNKNWFKTVSGNASILNLIETILLYIFFGAFILAVKNRIKR
jgi:hypothetical protein